MTNDPHQADEAEVCEVIITAPDADWLADFARRLIENHLVAAAHLFPIRSLYRWKGRLYDENETRAALHTRRSHLPTIRDLVSSEHPYEVPGFAVLLIAASTPYRDWVLSETG